MSGADSTYDIIKFTLHYVNIFSLIIR